MINAPELDLYGEPNASFERFAPDLEEQVDKVIDVVTQSPSHTEHAMYIAQTVLLDHSLNNGMSPDVAEKTERDMEGARKDVLRDLFSTRFQGPEKQHRAASGRTELRSTLLEASKVFNGQIPIYLNTRR